MSKKHVFWLYRELPELVSKGVLSDEAAERLRQHYGEAEPISKRRIALTIFSVVGAVLIGSGIILLLAYNWEQLTRPARVVLSLAPLIVGQALAAWTLWSGKESAAWRESTATFLMLGIGASIAVIGQTYHVPGDLGEFLFTWMILSLPLVYLMNASVTAVYMAGITWWSGFTRFQQGTPQLFWLFLALAIPHIVQAARENRYAVRPIFLSWALALCVSVGTGFMMEGVLPGTWIIVYSALAAVFYLAGHRWFGKAPAMWQRPFETVGALGVAVLSLVLTFRGVWEHLGWRSFYWGAHISRIAVAADTILAVALTSAALTLITIHVRKGLSRHVVFGAMPVLAIIGFSFGINETGASIAMVLFNVYLFALSIVTISDGVRDNRLGTVNFGMLMLAALIVARFFDSDIGFVARGVGFIVIGIGFLATNLMLVQRGKGGAQ